MTEARAGRVPDSVKRTLVFLVAAVCGAVSLSACGGSTVSDPAAAKVGSTTISRVTLDDELKTISKNSAFIKAVSSSFGSDAVPVEDSVSTKLATAWLSTLVNQAVADQVFAHRHLTVSAADKAAAQTAADGLFVSAATFQKLPRSFREEFLRRQDRFEAVRATLPKAKAATDAQLAAVLQQSQTSICPSLTVVARIQVPTKDAADAIETQLAQGADFATLAASSSTEAQTKDTGGLTACTGTDQYKALPADFRAGADALTVGKVSAPVQVTTPSTTGGAATTAWYVIKVQPWNITTARTILERLYAQSQQDPMTTFINTRLLKTTVWVDPRYGKVVRSKLQVKILPPVAPNPKTEPVDVTSTTSPVTVNP